MKAVVVEWWDAYAHRERWMECGEIDDDPMICRTVGWLLEDAKPEHTVVAQTMNAAGEVDGVLCVPSGMVRSVCVVFEVGGFPPSR